MVRETEIAAKDAADKARKASAYSALWLFISLLIGAFVASLAATFGGRRRDAGSRNPNSSPESIMRSLLLLFLGVPIPIIILIALFVR